ncbi:agmatinase [Thermincola ferriacetica]|uniref:Agmatinase n=1 Tax=Thermincola ferriacetica TaxID=281456 RepID=A0A0L6W675_9FIRM|nr:agmatinase [Thermincola ferriacetica]KNZ70956.1 agmatinase [Thermincola ferriacetica]
MHGLVEHYGRFMGSATTYEEANTVIIGIPMDFTVSFRPGTRMGPQAVRNVSYGLEEFSFYCAKDLADYSYFDWGDINLPFGNVPGSLDRIEQVVAGVLKDGKFPILIGGEHLVSYPIVKQVYNKYPDLVVLHFDAHADLRADYLGEVWSHATVMRKVAELIGGHNLYQFGIRSGTREELAYARENTNLFMDDVVASLKGAMEEFHNRPVYVTLDIDVIDPAFAPGTGTPEPGGCSSKEIIEAVDLMADLNVVGFDIVEVSPVFDQSERTSLLAAKLIREAILGFTKPRNMK